MKIKAQGLPVNIVVTVIIGLIIFGLGFALFGTIADESQDRVESLNQEIRTGLSSLECDSSSDWVCIPSYKMRDGDENTFQIYVTNNKELNGKYKLFIKREQIEDTDFGIIKEGCGSLIIDYATSTIAIDSGFSASFPFVAIATRVTDSCSFISTVYVFEENQVASLDNINNAVGKGSLIIKVE